MLGFALATTQQPYFDNVAPAMLLGLAVFYELAPKP